MKILKSNNGMIFLIEAIISLIILGALILTFNSNNLNTENYSLKALSVIEQENDLLKVWSLKESNTNEMIQDTKILFSNNATLKVNNKVILLGKITKECYSTNGEIITTTQKPDIIEIKVCLT